MIIYKIVNCKDGKVYIGQTVQSLARRWQCHIRDANKGSPLVLHRAMRLHGIGYFSVVEVSRRATKEELRLAEIDAIKLFNCRAPKGYNMTPGGDGSGTMLGRKHSEATRLLISRLAKERGITDEHRRKLNAARAAARIGKPSPNLGRPTTAEQRRKISEALRGRKANLSEETRRSMSEQRRGNQYSKGRNMGNQNAKGYCHTEDAKKRIGSAALGNRYAGGRVPWNHISDKPTKPCEVCGATITVIPAKYARTRCCSKSCLNRWMSSTKNGSIPYATKVAS